MPESNGKSTTQGIDLAQLFGAAAQALVANQGTLNQADTASGNHGDHIVQTFQLITDAVKATQGKPPADQLAYASKQLATHAKVSGSAEVYARGLSEASQQLKGQPAVTPDLAMSLVQTLLAGGQAQSTSAPQQSPGGDILGALLGGMQPSSSTQPAAGADLLGALLGGSQQSAQGKQQQDGLDLGDVLNAGLSFMQAKQSGQDNLQAAVGALMSVSPLSQQSHRQQSGEVVASTLLQVISAFAKK
jgi:hypothetical protein